MFTIKTAVKNRLVDTYSRHKYPIIINSYGRSGSTVLTNSIVNSTISAKGSLMKSLAFRSIYRTAWSLDEEIFKNGAVYKTHDFPPQIGFRSEIKVIYIYANPMNVVLSLRKLYRDRGDIWMREHFNHLNASYNDFSEIYENDILGLENHLNVWRKEKNISVAFIKYEKLWERKVDLENFIGFKIQLPAKRKRETNPNKNERIANKIAETYKPLIEVVKSLDDFYIINNESFD